MDLDGQDIFHAWHLKMLSVAHICYDYYYYLFLLASLQDIQDVQDIEQTGFSFTTKQLKSLLYPSLFTSDKICLDMRVEALPFCLLIFHFRMSDATKTKTRAETPQTISSTTPLSARRDTQGHTETHRGQRQGQWEKPERWTIYYLKTVGCIYTYIHIYACMYIYISHFSYTTQSQCDVLDVVNPTNRQTNISTHCSQWHHVAVTQKCHIFRWWCRCTGPSDVKRPLGEPAGFHSVLWRFLPRPSSTQTPHWNEWGCGHTWEWWRHPPLRLIQCCWQTPRSLKNRVNEDVKKGWECE